MNVDVQHKLTLTVILQVYIYSSNFKNFENKLLIFEVNYLVISDSSLVLLLDSWLTIRTPSIDSSSNVCIEDSSIATGDDAIAIKSGWDEYGIFYGRPSNGITIRRVRGSSPFSGIAIGSEASGGVENILVENVNIYNSGIGLHIKTTAGRGGYVKNVRFSDVSMNNVRTGVRIVGNAGDHPDDKYNPNALPLVDGVTVKNVWGDGVQKAGLIQGIKGAPFKRICLSNVKLWGAGKWQQVPWKCTDVSGAAMGVQPWPCAELTSTFETGFCLN